MSDWIRDRFIPLPASMLPSPADVERCRPMLRRPPLDRIFGGVEYDWLASFEAAERANIPAPPIDVPLEWHDRLVQALADELVKP